MKGREETADLASYAPSVCFRKVNPRGLLHQEKRLPNNVHYVLI